MRHVRRRVVDRPKPAGQSLVEFALILPIFVLLLLAVFDLGRGIYTYNGLSEAARDIARTAIVDDGVVLGAGVATQQTVTTQKGLVPGLRVVSFECLNFDGTASTATQCSASGNLIKVTVASSYVPVALLGLGGPIELVSASSLQIP
jgi:Flp pilus assembly protein TadG